MTLELSANGATYENGAPLEGAPAVLISATGVTFINLSNWPVSSNLLGQPAIRLTQGGNTIINRIDAVIVSYAGNQVAIEGSAGSDTIDNAGTIAGQVVLADGNDTYIQRHSQSSSTNINVDLGQGNDLAQFFVAQTGVYFSPVLAGGAGFDILQLDGAFSQFNAATVTGFERLVITNPVNSGMNFENFSGFSEIVLAADARVNFIASHNPGVNLVLNGGFVTLNNGSTVNSVTGSAQSEYLELGPISSPHSPVISSINLGGGDDSLWLSLYTADHLVPGLPTVIEGGSGYDRVQMTVPTGLTINMALFSGFEEVNTGTYSSATSNVRLIHLEAFLVAGADSEGSLTIGETNAPNLLVQLAFKSTITIESTATVGRIGYPTGPGWISNWDELAVANTFERVTVYNNGVVLGNIQLSLGNDLFDGRSGDSSGGTIFGYAGNDTIYGGASGDRINGGYGGDTVFGGGGNDRIDGGPGSDSLEGGAGVDTFVFAQRGLGDDVILDFASGELIDVSGLGIEDFATLRPFMAQAGNDVVVTFGYASFSETIRLVNVSLASLDAADFIFNTLSANRFDPGTAGDDLLFGSLGNDQIQGSGGNDRLIGGSGLDYLDGGTGADWLIGGLGNDVIGGGSNIDTAVVSGNRAAYTVTQTSFGNFTVAGPDGTDTLYGVEYVQFADQRLRLLPGTGTAVNFNADPDTYMGAIRDFDGNNLGAGDSWQRIGQADVDGDGDIDQFFVNAAIGRFAEVATGPDGLVYFSDHSWAGETRVVGTYIDPLVTSGHVVQGGPFDSQRRFQNDLLIDNIAGVLGAGDYDRDGLQEVYFQLTDGTAYLHAYMHTDGNIRYANYQSQQQVIDFLTANGWTSSTWAGWFPSGAEAPPKAAGFEADSFGFDEVELASIQTIYGDDGMARWTMDYIATQPLV